MKFLHFIKRLVYTECLIQFASAVQTEYALATQKSRTELQFAAVATKPNGLFFHYTSQYNNLYYLCPEKLESALQIVTSVVYIAGPQKPMCHYTVEPTIFQVEGDLENDLKEKRINLYHIGFAVNDPEFHDMERLTQYVSNDKNDYFMPMISVYRDKESHHTVAAKYKIITVDIQQKPEDDKALTYNNSNFFSNKIEELYRNQKIKLKDILGSNYLENKYQLVTDTLVNENDFIVETWKKTTRYKVHQILLWKENLSTWRNVQEFIRHIASTTDSLTTVTSGIGKMLTIRYAYQDYKMQWGQGKDEIFIPELYWIAVEFTTNQETSGMLVIMHNEPSATKNNVEKICDTNFCRKNGIWRIQESFDKANESVYCCPINAVTQKLLGISFLTKELNFFNGLTNIAFPPH